MSEFKICKSESFVLYGFEFTKWNGKAKCSLEEKLPKDAFSCDLGDGALYYKESEIGKEPHPFISFCEAARYVKNGWIVGIDHQKNCYFTPIFTSDLK